MLQHMMADEQIGRPGPQLLDFTDEIDAMRAHDRSDVRSDVEADPRAAAERGEIPAMTDSEFHDRILRAQVRRDLLRA